jgi:hypothetical protein
MCVVRLWLIKWQGSKIVSARQAAGLASSLAPRRQMISRSEMSALENSCALFPMHKQATPPLIQPTGPWRACLLQVAFVKPDQQASLYPIYSHHDRALLCLACPIAQEHMPF